LLHRIGLTGIHALRQSQSICGFPLRAPPEKPQ
jgi:hypothetical protein